VAYAAEINPLFFAVARERIDQELPIERGTPDASKMADLFLVANE
jgi:hypothetical protein